MIDTIVQKLYHAQSNQVEVRKFTDEYPDLSTETAYTIQEQLMELTCQEQSTRQVGWKLGLTSKAKQEMMGVHEPTYGVLLENMASDEGSSISLASFIHPKVEPEIAFIFNKDLRGPVSVPEVLAATAFVAPALEIIDSRYENFRFTLNDVIADNSSSAHYVIGDSFVAPTDLDLRLAGMVFKQNGKIIDTGAGAAVMGHPARAITWLVNKLSERGQYVKAGEVVLSGALCGAVTIDSGDVFSVSIDGLGSVTAVFSKE